MYFLNLHAKILIAFGTSIDVLHVFASQNFNKDQWNHCLLQLVTVG